MKALIALCFISIFTSPVFAEELSCFTVETKTDSAEYIELKSTLSPINDEMTFTASSGDYNYTVLFQAPDYENYWALIETKPALKPAYHAEGALRPRDNDPTQKIAVLEFYSDSINVKLQCTKKN